MSLNKTIGRESGPYRRAFGALLNAFAAVGTLWIFIIMLLIVADVVGRNFFSMLITGVAEIAARSVMSIVFLMLPAAALNNTLIRADFLIRHLRRVSYTIVHLMDMFFAIIGSILFALVALAVLPDTLISLRTAEFFGVSGVWTIPTLPFRILIVLGAVASSIAFLFSAFDSFLSSTHIKGH